MSNDTDPAERAWDEWVHRVNPQLDRRGVHDAFLAGYRHGVRETSERPA